MKLQEYGHCVIALYSLVETGTLRHCYKLRHCKNFVPTRSWVLEKMRSNNISIVLLQNLRIYSYIHNNYNYITETL